MRTLRCRLKFDDNKVVTAEASSHSPMALVPVHYLGPVERLGSARCEEGDLGYVEWYLRGRARHVQATIEVSVEGEYDQLWDRKREAHPKARVRARAEALAAN
jgi:hypothetical protein